MHLSRSTYVFLHVVIYFCLAIVFRVIERMKRKKETIHNYHEWEKLIKQKFSSVCVTGDMIFDHKGSFITFFKSSIASCGKKYQARKYKQYSFSATHKYCVKVSIAMPSFVSIFDKITSLSKTRFQHSNKTLPAMGKKIKQQVITFYME